MVVGYGCIEPSHPSHPKQSFPVGTCIMWAYPSRKEPRCAGTRVQKYLVKKKVNNNNKWAETLLRANPHWKWLFTGNTWATSVRSEPQPWKPRLTELRFTRRRCVVLRRRWGRRAHPRPDSQDGAVQADRLFSFFNAQRGSEDAWRDRTGPVLLQVHVPVRVGLVLSTQTPQVKHEEPHKRSSLPD